MNRKTVLWLGLLLFIMACELPGLRPPETPTVRAVPTRIVEILPTVTPACISPEPTQSDIDRALGFTGKLFESDEWEKSYTVAENKVSVSWVSATAVAYLEALIYPCSYEEPDINSYFSDENWKIIFQNYQSYEVVNECRDDRGLRLYQFEAISDGAEYDVNYWVKNDTNTRVISLMLVLPGGSTTEMDEYAYSLFPTLTTCP